MTPLSPCLQMPWSQGICLPKRFLLLLETTLVPLSLIPRKPKITGHQRFVSLVPIAPFYGYPSGNCYGPSQNRYPKPDPCLGPSVYVSLRFHPRCPVTATSDVHGMAQRFLISQRACPLRTCTCHSNFRAAFHSCP